jgi:two-component system, OmpR family, sensor kinase
MRPGSDGRLLRRTAVRLGLLTTVLVALIVVLLTGVATLVVLGGQHAATDRMLADTVARADDVEDPPSDVWLTIRKAGGEERTPGMPAGLPDLAGLDRVARSGGIELSDVDTAGGHFRVRTEKVGDQVVQAVRDLDTDRGADTRLVGMLLAVGGAGLILAAAAGFWLGRRAVRPLGTALLLQRRFVADASHELRTPLTLLSTRAQLLHRKVDPDGPVAADAAGLVRDIRQLNRILDDLLIAADPRAPDERVDLAAVVDDAIETLAPAADSIELGTTLARPAEVTGSAPALRRAVLALLDNAVQHARSRIDVTVTVHKGMIELAVGDDGAGIAPEALPRLFDRFASFRRNANGRRNYGLGLALVAEIAERHGGAVSAENGNGGAVLRLSLPRQVSSG